MGDALFSAFEKMETTRFVLKVRLLQTLILVQCILGVVHNTVYGSFGVFQLSHDDSVHLCLKNNSPEKSSRTDREIQILMFTLHAVTGLGIVAWYLCKSVKLLRKNSFELCRTDYARLHSYEKIQMGMESVIRFSVIIFSLFFSELVFYGISATFGLEYTLLPLSALVRALCVWMLFSFGDPQYKVVFGRVHRRLLFCWLVKHRVLSQT